ncbi:MAG: hypothetical protein V4642_02610 [Bacteroidota bacterium]
MKKLLVVLPLILLLCCSESVRLEFFPLLPSKTGTFQDKSTGKVDYFVVKNLDINNQLHIAEVDSFVLKKHDQEFKKYNSYQMLFYKYSRFGMNENFKHNEEDLIEWKGDDLLLEYNWQNGKFSGINYYKNGVGVKYYQKSKLISNEF